MDEYRKNSLEWGSKARKEDSRGSKSTDRQSLKKEASVNRKEKPMDNNMMLSEIKFLKAEKAKLESAIAGKNLTIVALQNRVNELEAELVPPSKVQTVDELFTVSLPGTVEENVKSVHQLFSEEEGRADMEAKLGKDFFKK